MEKEEPVIKLPPSEPPPQPDADSESPFEPEGSLDMANSSGNENGSQKPENAPKTKRVPRKQKESKPSPDEEKAREFGRFLTYYHLLLIPIILFLGNRIIGGLDWLGRNFFTLTNVQTGENLFWLIPVCTALFGLAVCSFRAWRSADGMAWFEPVFVTHGATAIGFVIAYNTDAQALSYLVATGVETVLFLVTLYFWLTGRAAARARG